MPRPKGNRKTARLSVSLNEDIYSELCLLAKDKDVSVAWLVRKAIDELIFLNKRNKPINIERGN